MSKSPSLRRIQADIRELSLDPSDRYHAAPLEHDMFEWHFTIRGAEGTDFEGGVYHGRILLPPDYPFKPPHIMFLTPSGRFETNTKICLSFSAYHPELWQPAWGIRLILEALISFLPTPADGAIGALDWTRAERKRLASQSVKWECPRCGPICKLLPEVTGEQTTSSQSKFQKEIEALQRFQRQEHSRDMDEGETKMDESAVDKEQEAEKESSEKESGKEDKEEDHTNEEKHKTIKTEEEEPENSLNEEEQSLVEPTPRQQEQPQNSQNLPTADLPLVHEDSLQSFWLSDPILQAIIVVLSITCVMLIRKIHALLDDLHALER